LLIMSGCKSDEEREFYIKLCIKESYFKRELERQIDSGYYERYMLSKEKLLPEPIKGLKENPFLDSYVIEFLDLPKNFKESDLRKGLIQNMKDFILEVGKDFTFIDEEYRVQVGGEDFRIPPAKANRAYSIGLSIASAFKNGEWFRVAGELTPDDYREARQFMLVAYPSLQETLL
jgi:predicted nuclease of restriction endonuclease-like (RecB) superfamily